MDVAIGSDSVAFWVIELSSLVVAYCASRFSGIGLTGGIGSGKSTVSMLLRRRGAVIVDADAIARDVVAVDTPGYKEIVATFGNRVVLRDGTRGLDRKALGDIIFSDAAARRKLNAITHSRIAKRMLWDLLWHRLVRRVPVYVVIARHSGARLGIVAVFAVVECRPCNSPPSCAMIVGCRGHWVGTWDWLADGSIIDAPLLLDHGTLVARIACSCIVAVHVDEQTQLRRIMERDGVPLAAARQKVAAQMTSEARERRSHHVLNNSGTLEDLEAEVDKLWKKMKTERRWWLW